MDLNLKTKPPQTSGALVFSFTGLYFVASSAAYTPSTDFAILTGGPVADPVQVTLGLSAQDVTPGSLVFNFSSDNLHFAGTSGSYLPQRYTLDFPVAQPRLHFDGRSDPYHTERWNLRFPSRGGPNLNFDGDGGPIAVGKPWTLDFPRDAQPYLDFQGDSDSYQMPQYGIRFGPSPEGHLDFSGATFPPYYRPHEVTLDFPHDGASPYVPDSIPGPFPYQEFGVPWADPEKLDYKIQVPWRPLQRLDLSPRLLWGHTSKLNAPVSLPWSPLPKYDLAVATPWGDLTEKVDCPLELTWRYPAKKDEETVTPWGYTAYNVNASPSLPWRYPAKKDHRRVTPWNLSEPVRNSVGGLEFPWGHPPKKDADIELPWGDGSPVSPTVVDAPWINEADYPPEWPDLLPIQPVYKVQNTVSVIRVSDSAPIAVTAVQISTDISSTAWTVNLALAEYGDLTMVDPSVNGPVEIQITINGFSLRAVIEGFVRSDKFGGSTWSAKGRSRSAELMRPYAPSRSYKNSGLTSGPQAGGKELIDLGTGWTLDWNSTSWVIEDGEFSYTNLTPLEAIAKLARAVGAVVHTHPTNKQLIVNPWYEHSPWEWAAETPDIVIPPDIMTTMSMNWKPAAEFNAVFVSGGNQGVNTNARRFGTAGDIAMPTIVDTLCTDVDAGIERARIEIARTGDRLEYQIASFITGAVTVVTPGILARIDDGDPWTGQVMRNSVGARVGGDGTVDVQQQMTVERYMGTL